MDRSGNTLNDDDVLLKEIPHVQNAKARYTQDFSENDTYKSIMDIKEETKEPYSGHDYKISWLTWVPILETLQQQVQGDFEIF